MTETQWEHDMAHNGDNADPLTGDPIDMEVLPPPADPWADVPEDYRAEVYGEVPHEAEDLTAIDLDRLAAEKLVKRYHRLNIEERDATQFIDDEIARARETLEALQARREELLAPIAKKRAWLDTAFRPLLEAWAKKTLEGAKTRTIKLAYGAVRFRKSPPRLEIQDPAAALAWAKVNFPAAVQEAVVKSELRGYVVESGEMIPGCELIPGEDRFAMELPLNITGGE